MNVLNIDSLVRPKRSLTLDGVSHPIKEMTVQEFIDSLDAANKLEESAVTPGSPESIKKATEGAVKGICAAIPTLGEEVVRSWPIDAMTTVLAFIRGDLPTSGQTDAGEAGNVPS